MHVRRTAALAAVTVVAALSLAACGSSASTSSTSSGSGSQSDTLTLHVDTVSTHGCVETNTFQRGADAIVWRVAVLRNGQPDKNATVVVHVKGGPNLKLAWDPHGSGPRQSWYDNAWFLPFNQPTGTVQYTITATDTKHNASATYTPQFMLAPSELMIVPYTYGVKVDVGQGSSPATTFAAGSTLPVSANVYWTTVKQGVPTNHPMTTGKVTAEIGLEGNLNGKGQLIPAATTNLTYNASSKTWTGSMPTQGLKSGVYVVQVNAQDDVTPANTGTGDSLAFEVQ